MGWFDKKPAPAPEEFHVIRDSLGNPKAEILPEMAYEVYRNVPGQWVTIGINRSGFKVNEATNFWLKTRGDRMVKIYLYEGDTIGG